MSYPVLVPDQTGGSEITLSAWLVQPGGRVEAGDIIAEIMTEKVNVEITSPVSGTIESLLVGEGEMVHPGQMIAEVNEA
jgi:pyruvate/2-oxoglutarate dehydrogenase complex dihydrolipoamide acyltransferase (E2) component